MIQVFILVLVGWIFALSLHEFSHALVAYYGGDTSVKEKGYLTFNPLRYTHPLLSIVLPLVFLAIGGIPLPGGAVYIEKDRLKSPRWDSLVSLAGPASSFLLAVVMGVPFLLGLVDPASESPILGAYALVMFFTFFAVLLNMIPVPPLDGFGVIAPFLPEGLRNWIRGLGGFGILLVFMVLWNNDTIMRFFVGITFTFMEVMGIPLHLVSQGYEHFMFWK